MRSWCVLPCLLMAACSSPLQPSAPVKPAETAAPARWALSGQSNAVGLKPALSALEPVVGVQQNSTAIAAWSADGPLWPALRDSLPGATAFIWWQGESDVCPCPGNPVSPTYRADLSDLIERVRQVTGPIPIVICSANSAIGYTNLRALQQDMAAARGWIYVPSNDLPQPGPGDFDVPSQTVLPLTFPVGASPHLSEAGYRAMAARIAAALQ